MYPQEEMLRRLVELCSAMLRTDELGPIKIIANGFTEITQKTSKSKIFSRVSVRTAPWRLGDFA